VAADDADDLYGLALDAFVPGRDALAKRLRAEGDRAAADEVKALRKPSVAAWAVNQTVRTQPKAARALWDAGDALIAAQEDLLGGSGDAAALRSAVEGERAAVDALVEAARGLLTSEGRDLGEATLERVRETLHAAAIDPDAREEVAAGRATRELAHAGLGPFGASVARAPAARARKVPAEEGDGGDDGAATGRGGAGAGEKPAAKRGGAAAKPRAGKGEKGAATKGRDAKAEAAEARRAEEARREEERRAAAEREAARKDAARRRAAAERELREATRALEKAQRAADRADARLREAEAAADEANAALDDARDRHAEAEAELEKARAEADAV